MYPTTQSAALLQDRVYAEVLEGVKLLDNTCQGSPVYQHYGRVRGNGR